MFVTFFLCRFPTFLGHLHPHYHISCQPMICSHTYCRDQKYFNFFVLVMAFFNWFNPALCFLGLFCANFYAGCFLCYILTFIILSAVVRVQWHRNTHMFKVTTLQNAFMRVKCKGVSVCVSVLERSRGEEV